MLKLVFFVLTQHDFQKRLNVVCPTQISEYLEIQSSIKGFTSNMNN